VKDEIQEKYSKISELKKSALAIFFYGNDKLRRDKKCIKKLRLNE